MTDNPYAQPQAVAGGPEYLEPKTSILAVMAFVISLVGLVACCIPGVGPLGLLLGVLALVMISTSGGRKKGGGFAIAAIVIGLVAGLINIALIWGASLGGKQWAEMGIVMVEVEDRNLVAVQNRLVSAQAQNLSQAQLDAFAASINADYGAMQERPKGLMDAVGLIMEVGQRMQNAQTDVQGDYPQSSYGVVPLALRYERGPVLVLLVVPGSAQSGGVAYSNIGYYNPNGDVVWLLPTPSGQGMTAPPVGSLPTAPPDGHADGGEEGEPAEEPGEG